MADEAPGKEAGDLVFVLQMQKHAVFKRRGADLYMEKDITLLEALTGVKFVLEHMDGVCLARPCPPPLPSRCAPPTP